MVSYILVSYKNRTPGILGGGRNNGGVQNKYSRDSRQVWADWSGAKVVFYIL